MLTRKNTIYAALAAKDMTISGDELYITGGSALGFEGNNGLGADTAIIGGGLSPNHIYQLNISIRHLECKGGNGGIAQSGGAGGNAGYGILYFGNINISKGSTVIATGGNGGNGKGLNGGTKGLGLLAGEITGKYTSINGVDGVDLGA